MTEDYKGQFAAYAQAKAMAKKKAAKMKYKNKFVTIDGIKFQSEKEGAFYEECKRRVAAGELIKFERQKTYKLEFNGVLICRYRADFILYPVGGGMIVVDVKSEFTREMPLYKIKKNLMLAVHGIKIHER